MVFQTRKTKTVDSTKKQFVHLGWWWFVLQHLHHYQISIHQYPMHHPYWNPVWMWASFSHHPHPWDYPSCPQSWLDSVPKQTHTAGFSSSSSTLEGAAGAAGGVDSGVTRGPPAPHRASNSAMRFSKACSFAAAASLAWEVGNMFYISCSVLFACKNELTFISIQNSDFARSGCIYKFWQYEKLTPNLMCMLIYSIYSKRGGMHACTYRKDPSLFA